MPPPQPHPHQKKLLDKESKRIKEFYTSLGEHCSDVIPNFELVNARKENDNGLNAESISDGVSSCYSTYPDPKDDVGRLTLGGNAPRPTRNPPEKGKLTICSKSLFQFLNISVITLTIN